MSDKNTISGFEQWLAGTGRGWGSYKDLIRRGEEYKEYVIKKCTGNVWKDPEINIPDIDIGETIPVNIVVDGEVKPAYCTNIGGREIHFHARGGLRYGKIDYWAHVPSPPK